ncbi:hypothetical protein [Candidatus Nitrososphaera gargensis]|uniref:hypothetical protein n=1 Tax=Candidatus Nitrososphaera gargensis TaxID=497727 RepID=UPI0011E4EA3D|nr:hypothetical protein [Candidatus Nitrososphaera gargensis]
MAALGIGTIIQTPEEASTISIMTPVSPYLHALATVGIIIATIGGAATAVSVTVYYLSKKKLR